jgi:hypothetical protein
MNIYITIEQCNRLTEILRWNLGKFNGEIFWEVDDEVGMLNLRRGMNHIRIWENGKIESKVWVETTPEGVRYNG